MYCKKCGAELNENLLCTSCGFQNSIDEENATVENIAEKNTAVENTKAVIIEKVKEEYKKDAPIVRNKIWAIISSIMFVISFIPLYKGYDKMNNYYSSDTYYTLNKNAYVGGDAYNYIINAGYATAYYVLAVGLAVLGVGFLIVYYLSGRKES